MNNDSFLPLEMQNPLTRVNTLRTTNGFLRDNKAKLPVSTVSWYEVELDQGPKVPNQLPTPIVGPSEIVDYKNFNSNTDWVPSRVISHNFENEDSWNVPSKQEIVSKQWEERGKLENEKLLKDLSNDPERLKMLKDLEDGKIMPKPRLIDESKKVDSK